MSASPSTACVMRVDEIDSLVSELEEADPESVRFAEMYAETIQQLEDFNLRYPPHLLDEGMRRRTLDFTPRFLACRSRIRGPIRSSVTERGLRPPTPYPTSSSLCSWCCGD